MISAHVGFFAACSGRVALPQLDWEYREARHVNLGISSDAVPQQVWQWTADSPTRDFRDAVWHKSQVREHNGRYVARMHYPDEGYQALFAEVIYDLQGAKLRLCTSVRIVKAR